MKKDLLTELDGLVSERRNPASDRLDELSTLDFVGLMNREDAGVAAAVSAALPEIAAAVDRIAAAFRSGGRLIYIGAGTSGRLGVLDASECPPTFGTDPGLVVGLIAGGDRALRTSLEGAEDDEAAAVADLDRLALGPRDVVVGLAVSGRTPYVVAALRHARGLGAATVAVACNPGGPVAEQADIAIVAEVGPEVLTGSTRLKSGTAQKMILNMLTTASMTRIGKVYGNLMVDLRATNDKLKARAARIVMQATGCDAGAAARALAAADQEVKTAIFIELTGLDPVAARAELAQANGVLRTALDARKRP